MATGRNKRYLSYEKEPGWIQECQGTDCSWKLAIKEENDFDRVII